MATRLPSTSTTSSSTRTVETERATPPTAAGAAATPNPSWSASLNPHSDINIMARDQNCDEPEKLGAEAEGEPGQPGARGIPCSAPRPAGAATPTPTSTSSTTASGSGCVLPPPAVDDVGSSLLSAAADELRTEEDEEVDEEPGVQVEAKDVEQPLIYDANRKSFAELLQTLPIARMYPELTERCVPVLDKWKETLPRSAWRKLMKKTQSPMPRVLKELNEAAPIIDRVLAFVKKNFHQKMNPDHDVAAGGADGGQSEANDAPFTIVDVGSGLGILSMFLAELLLPEEVKECYLVDKMWPTELNEKTFSDGLHMTKEHLKVDGATGKSLFPIPLRSLKMDIKKGRDLADLVHYIFENGTKATRGSGNRIGGRGPVEDGHIKVGEREDEEQNRQECQKQASSSAVPSPNPNRILLLGVHLCGSLSLRFVELVNKNPGTVEFAALKPCCLPGKMHLHHEMLYRVGKHEFTAQDVYYPDDQALVCEPVVNEEKAGHAADAQAVSDVLEDGADEELLEDQFAGAVNCDDDGLPVPEPKAKAQQASLLIAGSTQGTEHETENVDRVEGQVGGKTQSQKSKKPPTSTSSKSNRWGTRGGGRRAFSAWCTNVHKCIVVEEAEGAIETSVSYEKHRVAPHYFQDTFMFIERRRNANANAAAAGEGALGGASSASQHNRGLVYSEEDRGYRNQILIPRYQRKDEGTNEGKNKKERVEKIRSKKKKVSAPILVASNLVVPEPEVPEAAAAAGA